MFLKWICLIHILILKKTEQHSHRSRHNYSPEEYIEESEEQPYQEDYTDMLYTDYVSPGRRAHEHRKNLQYGSQQCVCSCEVCTPPVKPCCEGVCSYCYAGGIKPGSGTGNAPNNVVFMPYPVPLVIPNMFKSNNTEDPPTAPALRIQAINKTEASTTTTKAPETQQSNNVQNTASSISGVRNIMDLNSAAKRKRPSWVPKYGIVPIPDHLAVKLMTQLTEIRALKSRKI